VWCKEGNPTPSNLIKHSWVENPPSEWNRLVPATYIGLPKGNIRRLIGLHIDKVIWFGNFTVGTQNSCICWDSNVQHFKILTINRMPWVNYNVSLTSLPCHSTYCLLQASNQCQLSGCFIWSSFTSLTESRKIMGTFHVIPYKLPGGVNDTKALHPYPNTQCMIYLPTCG